MLKRLLLLVSGLAVAAAGPAPAQTEHHICRLLKPDEVKAFVGPDVALANVLEDQPERSVCQYEGESDAPLFVITIYWKGGKSQWKNSMAAMRAGDAVLSASEGVGTDSLAKTGMIKAGPVQGLGDAAYFSDLLPSLVLKGDMLIELNMSLLKEPEKKFRPIAEKLLGRI